MEACNTKISHCYSDADISLTLRVHWERKNAFCKGQNSFRRLTCKKEIANKERPWLEYWIPCESTLWKNSNAFCGVLYHFCEGKREQPWPDVKLSANQKAENATHDVTSVSRHTGLLCTTSRQPLDSFLRRKKIADFNTSSESVREKIRIW